MLNKIYTDSHFYLLWKICLYFVFVCIKDKNQYTKIEKQTEINTNIISAHHL